jgi:hypothetical protein
MLPRERRRADTCATAALSCSPPECERLGRIAECAGLAWHSHTCEHCENQSKLITRRDTTNVVLLLHAPQASTRLSAAIAVSSRAIHSFLNSAVGAAN